jgi:hypothetical protein
MAWQVSQRDEMADDDYTEPFQTRVPLRATHVCLMQVLLDLCRLRENAPPKVLW